MVAIENVDALRTWLTKKLSPVCDADPKALAKYVVALVKKEKSQADLKTLCKEQLDVFLQKETDAFVADLFDALNSKCYISVKSEPSSTNNENEVTNTQTHSTKSSSTEKQKENSRSHKAKSRSRSPHRVRSQETRRYNDDRRARRRSPMGSYRHQSNRRQRSRSSSPIGRSSRSSLSPGHKRRSHRSPQRHSRSPIRRKRIRKSISPVQSVENSSKPDEQKKKERCWDYDQKGFCMKGDLCPYDHGSDAVVVDDISISAGQKSDADKRPAVTAQPQPQPPSLLPRLPMSMPIVPPGMPPLTLPPPHILHQFPPPPLGIRSINPPILPPQPQAYNPEAPALHGIQNQQDNFRNPALNNATTGFAKSTVNQDGEGQRPFQRIPNNKTIIVKKIPPSLNNIAKLNEHFTKFGSINNIQVKFNMQPNQALVEFAHQNSARAAMRDTDAILNNRFIRAFWFNASDTQTPDNKDGTVTPTVKDRIGTIPNPTQLKYTAPSLAKKVVPTDISRTITNPQATPTDPPSKTESETATIEAKKAVVAARQVANQKNQQRQQLMLQKKMEFQKKKRGLLQMQVEQQKLLLAKLDNKNMSTSERSDLLKTLKALTSSTDGIRNDKSSKTEAMLKQNQKKKDLLDAELDLYNASTNGENTGTLKQKLNQLKGEAKTMGLVTGYRGGWNRGRGARNLSRGNHHRFIRSGANIDRRPCEIRVSGFQDEEKDEMIAHFSNFGEIDTLVYDEEGITCAIKYKARQDAENAASNGIMFKGRSLIIVWTSQPAKPAQRVFSPQTDNGTNAVNPTSKSKVEVSENPDEDDDEDDISVVVEPVVVFTPPQDDFGYGILEEELDEEALLTGGDEDDDVEERSWRH